MPRTTIFIVTTTDDEGKSKHLSEVNSHSAAWKHHKRRNVPRPYQLQTEGTVPQFQSQKKPFRQGITNNIAGVQKPWLVANRPEKALYSELVPVIRWPVEFTSYEKSLVHFLLDEGRRFSFGEGLAPSYSLAFDWAYRLLESTPMFAICHIVMSEHFMHQLHGRTPTKVFYARQAHAYRFMNDLLNSESTSCDDKLLGFAQVICMDLILGRNEIRRQHFRAMDEYIELCGGLGHILAMPRDSRSALDPWRWILYFCYAEFPIPTYPRFAKLVDRFLMNLRCIRGWVQAPAPKSESEHESLALQSPKTRRVVDIVREYVQWAFDDLWKGTQEYSNHQQARTASLCFIFILCLAQAQYSYDTTHTLQLFTDLAPRVAPRQVKDPICVFPRLHPISAMSSMAYVRENITYDKAKEVPLCEATVDVVKIASVLPASTMTKLVQTWIDCAFHSVGSPLPPSTLEPLIEDSLYQMEVEIWSAWNYATRADETSKSYSQDVLRASERPD